MVSFYYNCIFIFFLEKKKKKEKSFQQAERLCNHFGNLACVILWMPYLVKQWPQCPLDHNIIAVSLAFSFWLLAWVSIGSCRTWGITKTSAVTPEDWQSFIQKDVCCCCSSFQYSVSPHSMMAIVEDAQKGSRHSEPNLQTPNDKLLCIEGGGEKTSKNPITKSSK